MFAKLYGTEVGQILVKRDEGDEGPEIRYFFRPEGLGVCSIALKFTDSENGWDALDKAFDKIDEKQATALVKGVIEDTISEFTCTG